MGWALLLLVLCMDQATLGYGPLCSTRRSIDLFFYLIINFINVIFFFRSMDRELPNMRLSGPLPPELGKLEQLQYMYYALPIHLHIWTLN